MSGCTGCPSDMGITEVEQKEIPKDVPVVTLTEQAAQKIKEFMKEDNKEGYGLRVMVQVGGCAGYQYGMDYDEKSLEGDIVLEQLGVKLFIDPASAGQLAGTVIDFVDSLHGSGFKIENPNASQGCGCGKSFN